MNRANPLFGALGLYASRHRGLVLFALLLACYAYFPPRWADWNQNSRFDLVLSIVDDGRLDIDRYVANTGDYAEFDGHYYSDKAPGMALLGVPVYAVYREGARLIPALRPQPAVSANQALVGTLRRNGLGLDADRLWFFVALALTTLATVAVPAALLAVILYRTAGGFGLDARQSFALALAFGLATIAFPYSNAFYGHQPSATMLFAAFGMAFAIRRGRLRRHWLVAIGLLLGYAAVTEYPNALIVALLVGYILWALGKPVAALFRLVLGGVLPLAVLAVFNRASFGTILPVGYLHSALFPNEIHAGFFSLTYPHLDALWGTTFGLQRGLFFLSPYLLLAVPGYVAIWRDRERRAEFWVLSLAPALLIAFNSSSTLWTGGFAVGPRYVVPSLPFLALAAGVGLVRTWRHPALRPVLVLACAWSLFAVWVETIAGQSFPDYTPNPLFDYSLPMLLHGDVARNLGMVFGLSGLASLAPLVALLVPGGVFASGSSSLLPLLHAVPAGRELGVRDRAERVY